MIRFGGLSILHGTMALFAAASLLACGSSSNPNNGGGGSGGGGGGGGGTGGTCLGQIGPTTETFTEADQPDRNVYVREKRLHTPWGYNKPENATRQYPLVVVITSAAEVFKPYDTDVPKKFPSFYLEFGDPTQGKLLDDCVKEALNQGYRIDTSRLYTGGFSVGGSGSYTMAESYYSQASGALAGILRMAGMSDDGLLPVELVKKTSVWYHLGTADTDGGRQEKAAAAYGQYQAVYPSLQPSTEPQPGEAPIVFGGYERTTNTLTDKNGIQIFKYSRYQDMTHTASGPLADPAIYDWLFAQSTACRTDP